MNPMTPEPATEDAGPAGSHDEGPSVALEQLHRPQEELNMLYMGFGVGMIIGLFFLIYVVLAIASQLASNGILH